MTAANPLLIKFPPRGTKPTGELARKFFEYDPETGIVKRKLNTGKGSGKRVGTLINVGYYKAGFLGREYMLTHLIWLIVYDRFPIGIIEHKDLNKTNNRLDNLREATQSQNGANVQARLRNNTSTKGVFYDVARRKYKATIMLNYKTINLGRFDTLEEAKQAYDAKATELFGEFARV